MSVPSGIPGLGTPGLGTQGLGHLPGPDSPRLHRAVAALHEHESIRTELDECRSQVERRRALELGFLADEQAAYERLTRAEQRRGPGRMFQPSAGEVRDRRADYLEARAALEGERSALAALERRLATLEASWVSVAGAPEEYTAAFAEAETACHEAGGPVAAELERIAERRGDIGRTIAGIDEAHRLGSWVLHTLGGAIGSLVTAETRTVGEQLGATATAVRRRRALLDAAAAHVAESASWLDRFNDALDALGLDGLRSMELAPSGVSRFSEWFPDGALGNFLLRKSVREADARCRRVHGWTRAQLQELTNRRGVLAGELAELDRRRSRIVFDAGETTGETTGQSTGEGTRP